MQNKKYLLGQNNFYWVKIISIEPEQLLIESEQLSIIFVQRYMFFVVSTSTSMIIFSAIRLQKALNTDNDNKLLLKFVKNLKNMDKNH
jgi:hypothetical protein